MVGRTHDEHPSVVAAHAVQIAEQLAHQHSVRTVAGSLEAEGVHLVEKQHCRRIPPCLFEERMQILLTLPFPHVEHVIDSDVDELGP